MALAHPHLLGVPPANDGAVVSEENKGTRRKRRTSEEVASRLLEAAEEEFKRCGYTGATTAAIARRAESTEAQLFRMFSSKAALFQEAVFRPLDTHLEQFNDSHAIDDPATGNRRENARLYIAELQRFLQEHSQLLLTVLTASLHGTDSDASARAISSLSEYFERGAAVQAKRLGNAPRIDPKLMVRVSFAAVLANVMFKDVLFPAGLASDEEIDDAVLEFVLDGINANKD